LVAAGTLFGNTTSLQGTITNSATLIFDQSSSGTYAGTLSGTGSLLKTQSGTLILTGANSQSGTTIGQGTLQIGDGGTTGSLAGAITNNASLVYNRSDNLTQSASISGTGSLNKSGAGTLVLSASSIFSGGTTLSAGALRIENTSALGTGSLVQSDGASTLQINAGGTIASSMALYKVAFINGGNTLSGTITNLNTVYDVAAGTTNTLSGFVTGSGGLELIGGGVLAVTGATNNYAGATILTNGTLRVGTLANAGSASSIGTNGSIVLAGSAAADAVVDYTGGDVTMDRSLVLTNGGGTVAMASPSTTMTMTGSASGSGALVLSEGKMVLSNTGTPNSFAPALIQVDSGAALQLGADDQIGNTTSLILNGGTFIVGTSDAGYSETLGTLTLSASSTIDLGSYSTGLRQLIFANSSGITWTGTLTITNWQGVANTSSDVAEILFGSGGLTSTQLAQVYWANENINGGTLIGGNGELAPIPEARVVWGAAAIAAVVFWRERRLILKLAQGVRRRPLWTRRGMASALRK
jgi:autotransporter-associated beta strand protein